MASPLQVIALALVLTCLPASADVEPTSGMPAPAGQQSDSAPPQVDATQAQETLSAYTERMRDRILQSWQPPVYRTPADTSVSFTVNADGSITDLVVTNTCGDPKADEHALQTVRSISPLDPLPSPTNSIVIDLAFQSPPVHAEGEGLTSLESRQKAAEENPQDAKAAYEYGRALRFAGRFTEATEHLQKAVDLGMEGPEPCLELGQALKKVHKNAQAEKMLREAVARQPEHLPSLKAMADLLFEEKRWTEAKEAYQHLLKVQPDGPFRQLAKTRIELCDYQGEEPDDE